MAVLAWRNAVEIPKAKPSFRVWVFWGLFVVFVVAWNLAAAWKFVEIGWHISQEARWFLQRVGLGG